MSKAKIETGKKVPDFTAESTAGDWRLKDALGKNVVVYFYPRDNTSGCTKEGEAFRDAYAAFKKAKTVIVSAWGTGLATM